MYRTVLVPLDRSKCAEAILPHVEELARAFGSTLVLLHVLEQIPGSTARTAQQVALEDIREEQKRAEKYLNELQARLSGKGLKARWSILYGNAVARIMEAAQEENADLIAMGSHGRTGLSKAFYGSVAAGVLHRVDRPLLLVRSKEK